MSLYSPPTPRPSPRPTSLHGRAGLAEGIRRFTEMQALENAVVAPKANQPTSRKHRTALASHQAPSPHEDTDTTPDTYIRRQMEDPRYWKSGETDDAHRDRVTQMWKAAYPGTYEPGSWGRNSTPALSAKDLAERFQPPQSDASETSHNDRPPGTKPDETQVASASLVLRILGLGAASAGAAGAGSLPKGDSNPPDIGETIDELAERAADGNLLPNVRIIPGPTARIFPVNPIPPLEGYPADGPDIDGREEFPADTEANQGTIITTPDGSELGLDQMHEAFPDQSEELPQGTLVHIQDSQGNDFDIDVSGALPDRVDKLVGHLNQIPDEHVRDAVKQLTGGGRLTTSGGARQTVTEITVPSGGDPAQSANDAFDDVVRKAGGDPTAIPPKGDKNLRLYELPDGTMIIARSVSSRKSGYMPTNEVHIYQQNQEKPAVAVDIKIRYEDTP